MPISETPISAPKDQAESSGLPPESPSGSDSPSFGFAPIRRSRYDELDHTDLLHVIEELEGSRNWTSLREKLWIALIIHMLIAWYLIYGPKYIYHVHVVDPSVVLKQRQKELTYLDMPKDLMKPQKPKPTNIISDKNRVAETPHPTLDRKTLEELEAMRRAGPPKQSPAPPAPKQAPAPAQQAPQQPSQQQQQQAQNHPPSPPAQPLPQKTQPQLENPPVAAPQPNFRAAIGSSDPTEQLQRELRRSMSGAGESGGENGLNAPPQHPGMQGAVQVLSDTQGVDFANYIHQVILETQQAWYPIIPEEARSPINKQGKVLIRFKIYPDGSVHNMVLESPSGDTPLDKAAWGGITGASPYPPLPKAFHGPFLELRFYFLYNIRPGDQ